MKRVVFVFAAVAALLLTGAATPAAGPTDWKQVSYFDAQNSELHLQLTQPGWDSTHQCDWTGPAGGTYVTNVNGPDYTGWGCLSNYLWAKTCTAGSQTVKFTKKIFLPGGASDLAVSLQSYGDKQLDMGIEINGRVALNTVKSVHKLDIRGKGRLFKHGLNTITVHAKKGPTGKTPCNLNGPEYAVFAQIYAKFSADLVVTPPVRSGLPFSGTFTVHNAGPSDESYTSVVIGAYTSHLKDLSGKLHMPGARILMDGPGLDTSKCQYSYSQIYYKSVSYTGYSASCPITALKAGQTVTIKALFAYDAPPSGAFYDEWPFSWGAAGDLADPNTANNGGMRMQSTCRLDPAHPDPRCKQK